LIYIYRICCVFVCVRKVGERVICLPKYGAWSEYLIINTNYVYKMPENMTFKDAAALSYNYLTAYILLFELGGVKSGQSVLFHSAGGGVGEKRARQLN
jgi:NADPH:quinone reductase-like Zn-dependent oxidoreductase